MKVQYEVVFEVNADDYKDGKLTDDDIKHLASVINTQVEEIAKKDGIRFRIKQVSDFY